MPETPLISIIIVAYKSRDEIGACLASLPPQIETRAVEAIVVDNSLGADGVAEIIEEKFPWVTYISPDANLGFGRANNLGYASSQGEFVLFLNPDTICNEHAL